MSRFIFDDAIEALIDYTLTAKYDFAVELMNQHEQFDPWAEQLLSETIYGAVNILAFRNNSDAEMMRDLKELWDANREAP
jgi:hypothetical protein